MRVLVTGASGQVGASFSAKAKGYGLNVIEISRQNWDMAKFPQLGEKYIVNHRPDLVLNCAAFTDVNVAEQKKEAAFAVNEIAVHSIARGCKKLGVPLLHLSTDYVFNGQKGTAYVETDELDPLNIYGASKAAGEVAIMKEAEYYLILRTSWIFSASGVNFINKIQEALRKNNAVSVVNDQIGCPTSAESLSDLIMTFVKRFDKGFCFPNGIYHFAGWPAVSWYDLAVEIAKVLKVLEPSLALPEILACRSSDFKSGARRPTNSSLDSSKLYKDFDYLPCNWKEDLESLLNKPSSK